MMRRREFITLLGAAAAAWPLAARAQQAAKRPVVGFLGDSTPLAENERAAAFARRLHDLGWIEGRTIAIEYHRAPGSSPGATTRRNHRALPITAAPRRDGAHRQMSMAIANAIGATTRPG